MNLWYCANCRSENLAHQYRCLCGVYRPWRPGPDDTLPVDPFEHIYLEDRRQERFLRCQLEPMIAEGKITFVCGPVTVGVRPDEFTFQILAIGPALCRFIAFMMPEAQALKLDALRHRHPGSAFENWYHWRGCWRCGVSANYLDRDIRPTEGVEPVLPDRVEEPWSILRTRMKKRKAQREKEEAENGDV